MNLQILKGASVTLAFVFGLVCVDPRSHSIAQEGTSEQRPVVSEQTYNLVLDALFPREEPGSGKSVFTFVLRYKPRLKAESQIVIRRGVQRIEVIEYESADGDIYAKVNEFLRRGAKENASEMAKSIRVKRREVNVPYAQIKSWYRSFFDSLSSTTGALKDKGEEFDRTGGSETVFLHGSFYDLWYKQRLNEMSFKLYDYDGDDLNGDTQFKLVKWMNAVRRDVVKLR